MRVKPYLTTTGLHPLEPSPLALANSQLNAYTRKLHFAFNCWPAGIALWLTAIASTRLQASLYFHTTYLLYSV